MSSKNKTQTTAPVTEEEVIAANHTLEVNGHLLHLTTGKGILMIRNEVETGLPLLNITDDNLSKAFSTAWLGLIDKRYPVLDKFLHLRHSPEELAAMEVCSYAGFMVVTKGVPYASTAVPASDFQSIPEEPGVYLLSYLLGQFKVRAQMLDRRWAADEPKWVSRQRSARNKHIALNWILQGRNINARHFPRTDKYIATVEDIISIEDPGERAEKSAFNIAQAAVAQTDFKLGIYEKKLEAKGETFVSAVPVLKLADGSSLTRDEIIGKTFRRWMKDIEVPSISVSDKNVEHFLSVVAQNGLVVAVK